MTPERSRAFFRLRVGVLLAVLFFVVLWAWRDVRSRRQRNAWDRSLSIAIVLVRRGPLADAAAAAFRSRVPALEQRLADELRRYRPDAPRPFMFTVVGPIEASEPLPKTRGDGVVAAAEETWALWRWTSRVDREGAVDASAYDSRIYVAARAPENAAHEMIEGQSEEGGRVGTVEVELDESMADFALFVTAHELLHTLGASDKYDADGKTSVPDGLAEPDLVPRFPQRRAEVMARNLPLSTNDERPPTSLDELGIGPLTAREIGWSAGPP